MVKKIVKKKSAKKVSRSVKRIDDAVKVEKVKNDEVVVKFKLLPMLLKTFLLAALLYGVYHSIMFSFYEGLSIIGLLILIWLVVLLIVELRRK